LHSCLGEICDSFINIHVSSFCWLLSPSPPYSEGKWTSNYTSMKTNDISEQGWKENCPSSFLEAPEPNLDYLVVNKSIPILTATRVWLLDYKCWKRTLPGLPYLYSEILCCAHVEAKFPMNCLKSIIKCIWASNRQSAWET
jgi:hypothetical protein